MTRDALPDLPPGYEVRNISKDGFGQLNQFDREVEYWESRYAAGEITLEQLNKEIREIERDMRDARIEAAEDAARSAYDAEMERW